MKTNIPFFFTLCTDAEEVISNKDFPNETLKNANQLDVGVLNYAPVWTGL